MAEHAATGNETITVELFGMPRVLAGTDRAAASGDTLRDVLQHLVQANPALGEHLLRAEGDWLNAGYTFVVDGRFTDDQEISVGPESEILLVSRASGG